MQLWLPQPAGVGTKVGFLLLSSGLMSFSATLTINNKDYTLRRFSWSVEQHADEMGRPEARVRAGRLEVELDSEPDETLHHWATDHTKRLNGEILVIAPDNQLSRRKTIVFEDACCVGLNKYFDGSASAQSMVMRLTISARRLSCGEVELDNKWLD